MSFLKELTDKGATIAWSNVAAHPSLIALGTKVDSSVNCVCMSWRVWGEETEGEKRQ